VREARAQLLQRCRPPVQEVDVELTHEAEAVVDAVVVVVVEGVVVVVAVATRIDRMMIVGGTCITRQPLFWNRCVPSCTLTQHARVACKLELACCTAPRTAPNVHHSTR
jgi:hypothetical protein